MISFVTFAYNEGKYIEETINSVICLGGDIEYILVDDNSTDETWDIMQKYAKIDSRIKAYRNPKKGKNSAVNFGMSKTTGDWVTILGGDDIFESVNFSKFVEKLKEFNPREAQIFVGGLLRRFTTSQRYLAENGVLNAFPKRKEKRANTIGFASRLLVDNVYPIPEQYPNEDSWTAMYYYYFCDLLINIPIVCLNYRIHDNNSINHNDTNFEKYSHALHIRMNQQMDFIARYEKMLSKKDIKYLSNQYKAENFRYEKKYLRLLLVNIAWPEKLRMLLNSNKALKTFKYRITKLFQEK